MPTPPIEDDDEVTDVGPITIDLSSEAKICKLVVSSLAGAYPLNANIVANPLAGCVELFAKYLAAALPLVENDHKFISVCNDLNIKFQLVTS